MNARMVRNIHVCPLCDRVGEYTTTPTMLPGLVKVQIPGQAEGVTTYVHPTCYEIINGRKALLALPMSELKRVRLNEVSEATLTAILQQVAKDCG